MFDRRAFALMLPPGRRVEVIAPTIAAAIRCGCAALPHFVPLEEERGKAIVVSVDIRSTLTCLICGRGNPARAEANSLIAMQEHLMEWHGLTQKELHQTIRVFSGASQEGQYIWCLDADPTYDLVRPYMRASRYATRAHGVRVTDDPLPIPSFVPGDLAPNRGMGETEIELCGTVGGGRYRMLATGEDALAWYSCLHEESEAARWLVWPKGLWQRLP